MNFFKIFHELLQNFLKFSFKFFKFYTFYLFSFQISLHFIKFSRNLLEIQLKLYQNFIKTLLNFLKFRCDFLRILSKFSTFYKNGLQFLKNFQICLYVSATLPGAKSHAGISLLVVSRGNPLLCITFLRTLTPFPLRILISLCQKKFPAPRLLLHFTFSSPFWYKKSSFLMSIIGGKKKKKKQRYERA